MASVHPDDLLAAYSLDALTDEERAAVAAHVAECQQCHDWLARHGPTTEVLALSIADSPAPRADLRDRIMTAAARTEQIRPEPVSLVVRRRSLAWSRLAGWLAAAALFLTTLGLGVWNVTLRQELQALQPATPLSGVLLATADAPGAQGSLAVRPGSGATLSVANLPPPQAGQVFEAWVIDPQGPHPAGTFVTTPDGHGLVGLSQPPRPGEVVAVTTEPSPGRAAPSGKILLKGTLNPGA